MGSLRNYWEDKRSSVENDDQPSINSLRKDEVVQVTEVVSDSDDAPYIDLTQHLSEGETERRKKSKWFQFRLLIWDSADKHPLERKFLAKLDWFLMSSSMLGYFIKTLNANNMKTAYINGMDQYYTMNDNQYNYLQTMWTVGYIIGQIPSNLILHRISARYYLGGLEILWAVLTVLMITCKNLNGLYAIRFFVGLTEAGYFPGLEYLVGSWYSEKELSKRSAFFNIAGVASGLVSGPLQSRILTNFAHSKMPPFKWMFVFDAVISFPIGIYTMFVDPNTPSTTNAWYWTETDKLVALERRRRIGAQLNTRSKYTWKKIKSFFNTWHIFVFPLLFLAYNNSAGASASQPTFETWLISIGKPQQVYNTMSAAVSGTGIGVTIILSLIADFIGGRKNYLFMYGYFFFVGLASALLLGWRIPRGLHFVSYFFLGVPTTWGQPQIFSWVNRLMFKDDMKRNFVVVCTNVLAYVTNAFIPIFVWNTDDKPRYFDGYLFTLCLCGFGLCMTALAQALERKDNKRQRQSSVKRVTP